MTTLAYHHGDGTISYDSRSTAGGTIVTDSSNKTYKKGNLTFVMCGVEEEIQHFIREYKGRGEASEEWDACGFLIDNDKVYGVTIIEGKFTKFLCEYDYAFGSGCRWAMAAMDFGKSSSEAVKYAKTRDTYTGGRVKTIKLRR